MVETNVSQHRAVNHHLSKMMPEAGTLQAPPALLFLRQLTVPPEALAVPAVCAWGKGSNVLPAAGADTSIAHPEHLNPPGITAALLLPAAIVTLSSQDAGCNSRGGGRAGTSLPVRIDPFICSEP